MSSAIDFNLSSERASTRYSAWQTGQKERLLAGVVASDFRQECAKAATDADQPDPTDTTGLFGFCRPQPTGRVIEGCSAILSLLCLMITIILLFVSLASREDGNMAEIRFSREVMLFTNKHNMTQAMRHLQAEYRQYCKSENYTVDLQVPTWDTDNAKRFKSLSNTTSLGMSINVHSSTVSLFAVVWPIYLFSFLFQLTRYRTYCTLDNKKGLYKPWLGPDFSRWLEYLVTSPFQIFVVSSAFGFTNIDTVLGQCGMQAALVLLGYNIEQQIKKVYKRDADKLKEGLLSEGYADTSVVRLHHIFWPSIPDIRASVYLVVAWFLHLNIWLGIYTRFELQDKHGQRCEANPNSQIPDVVKYILSSQFVLFTLFGVVNSWQYAYATPRAADKRRASWNFYSQCYAVLSVTAKTMLEVGFLVYVSDYKTWPVAKESNVVQGNMHTGQQCWAVQYKA
jgi:hypothetical protein